MGDEAEAWREALEGALGEAVPPAVEMLDGLMAFDADVVALALGAAGLLGEESEIAARWTPTLRAALGDRGDWMSALDLSAEALDPGAGGDEDSDRVEILALLAGVGAFVEWAPAEAALARVMLAPGLPSEEAVDAAELIAEALPEENPASALLDSILGAAVVELVPWSEARFLERVRARLPGRWAAWAAGLGERLRGWFEALDSLPVAALAADEGDADGPLAVLVLDETDEGELSLARLGGEPVVVWVGEGSPNGVRLGDWSLERRPYGVVGVSVWRIGRPEGEARLELIWGDRVVEVSLG